MVAHPQGKKGLSPKLSEPWEVLYVVLDRISDVVYRIQRGSRARPNVVHRNRMWIFCGTTRAYWLKDQPVGRQESELEGGVPQQATLMSNSGTQARRNRRRLRRRPTGSSPKD